MMNQLLKSRPPKARPTMGMIRSLTSESTILPKAAPMMTPTARSTTFPLTANSRNSDANDMTFPSLGDESPTYDAARPRSSDRGFAALAGAYPHHLLDRRDEDLSVPDLP